LISKLLTLMEFIIIEINDSDEMMDSLAAHDQLMGLMELLKQTLQTMISYTLDDKEQNRDPCDDNIQLHIIRVVSAYAQSEEDDTSMLREELSTWFPKMAQFLVGLAEKHVDFVTIKPVINIYLKTLYETKIHTRNIDKEDLNRLEVLSSLKS